MSRPEGKAECEWMHKKCLDYKLDNKKPSEKHWRLGHIDCKISNNIKSTALNVSEARPKKKIFLRKTCETIPRGEIYVKHLIFTSIL